MTPIRITPCNDGDVIIAGAGPAGAAAAAYLARAGLDVILLDRQRFPRDKVCGDFVGPVALIELQQLGVTRLPEYQATNIVREAALFLDGKKLINKLIPEIPGLPSHGRVIPRMDLDQWILDTALAAGVDFRDGHRVTGFEADDRGIVVTATVRGKERRIRGRLLIGADGSGSLIARQLRGRKSRPEDRIVAVRAYYEDVAGDAECADLYFTGESFPGYYWLFPTGEGTANVGVGMALETFPASSVHLRNLLQKLIDDDPALHKRLENARMVGKVVGWPLSTYNPGISVVDDRVLLVGDAAGLINPLNGEGIQYALLSARWAADVIHENSAEDAFRRRDLAGYVRKVERDLRFDMALATLIVQLIRNRSLTPVWLEALKIIVARARLDPDYAEIAGGILAGLLPASEAISMSFVSKTVDQAIFSLALKGVIALFRGELVKAGADLAKIGVDLAVETTRHPMGLVQWGTGVATGVAELTWQVSKNVLAGDGPSSAHGGEQIHVA